VYICQRISKEKMDMNTSFHFALAQEVTPTIIDAVRRTYQD